MDTSQVWTDDAGKFKTRSQLFAQNRDIMKFSNLLAFGKMNLETRRAYFVLGIERTRQQQIRHFTTLIFYIVDNMKQEIKISNSQNTKLFEIIRARIVVSTILVNSQFGVFVCLFTLFVVVVVVLV